MSTAPAAAPAAENMKKKRIYQLIMAIAGTVLTILVQQPNASIGYSGMNNIIASAGLALVAGVFFKKHFDIFFSGTFAGMCAATIIPNLGWAVLLGAMVFVIWVLLEKKFAGVGGKFGTIAMISGLIVSLIAWTIEKAWPVANYAMLDWICWLGAPAFGALACAMTLYLRNKGELVKNTTVASAMVGLVGAFLLLLITAKTFDNTTTLTYGFVFSAVVYTASFAGMASKDRLKNERFNEYISFAITGAMAGLIILGIWGILGYGGKYGFSGFLAVLVFNKLLVKLLNKRKAAPAA